MEQMIGFGVMTALVALPALSLLLLTIAATWILKQ